MKTIKYIITIILIDCFCFALAFSQILPTAKKKNKGVNAGELPLITIQRDIINDMIIPINMSEINSCCSLVDSSSFVYFETCKISILSVGGFYNNRQVKGNYSLYENNIPFMDFMDGDGNDISFGVGYEFYISNCFSIGTELLYDKYLIASSTNYLLPIINDKFAITEHTAKLNIQYITADIALKCELFSNMQIFTGFKYNYVLNADYNHIVKIKSGEIIYSDGSMEKHFNEKKLDNTNNCYSAIFGISYRIPFITNNCGVAIDAGYEKGLNKIFNNSDLKNSSIYSGLKLIYIY